MSESETPSQHYRRLAEECLEVAYTFPEGVRRTVLIQTAQVWQRLADEYADSRAPLSRSIEGEGPAMQQQEQIQRDKNEKES
jgi:hypothetical protein